MPHSNSTLLYTWFQEVWNNGNENIIDTLMTDQAIAHGVTDDKNERGPAAFKKFYHSFRDDFTDIQVDMHTVVAEDDFESAHCTVNAKHVKSGKDVHFSGICMAKITDGKIEEAWNHFDFLSLNQQLGFELKPKELELENQG